MTFTNVALVGAGQMGANHARTISRSDSFNLSFIVDADVARATKLTQQFGGIPVSSIDDIRDVQAAVVATSTSSHFEIVKSLLESKVPVLCEKPLTTNIDVTTELLEISKRNSIPIQCGFVERFNPAFLTARKFIDEPIVHAQSVRHSPPAGRAASGVAEDLLIHDLDLALSLTSSSVTTVAGSVYRSEITQEDEISECIVAFQNGSLFTLSASRMSQRKIREWRICTATHLYEVDLLRQTVAIYENINQEVGTGGGASYRARTTVDYPFIERSGEPLALQLQYFGKLLSSEIDQQKERDSILASHEVLSSFLQVSAH